MGNRIKLPTSKLKQGHEGQTYLYFHNPSNNRSNLDNRREIINVASLKEREPTNRVSREYL